jgi:hypothetical protein
MEFLFSGPCPAVCFQQKNARAEQRSVAILRTTFDIADDGSLSLRSPQPRINFREIAFGDMSSTPPKRESDLAPEKPKVDLIVNGTAHAPGGLARSRFEVAVGVYPKSDSRSVRSALHERRLSISGPRVWRHSPNRSDGLEWSLGEPAPAVSVPVRFDKAYGGTVTLEHEGRSRVFAHRDNPVGVGYLPSSAEVEQAFGLRPREAAALLARHAQTIGTMPAPQITQPGTELVSPDRPAPLAGWGIVAKHWRLRHRHAGTMDAAWEAERYPLLPRDFDPLYWCGAHPEMQLDQVPPESLLKIDGMVPAEGRANQTMWLALPAIQPQARVFDGEKSDAEMVPLKLDTISVDMDDRELTLLYRVNVAHPESLVFIHLFSGVDA